VTTRYTNANWRCKLEALQSRNECIGSFCGPLFHLPGPIGCRLSRNEADGWRWWLDMLGYIGEFLRVSADTDNKLTANLVSKAEDHCHIDLTRSEQRGNF
jgi:hypothetical protein